MKNKLILAALCSAGLVTGCNQAAENTANENADSNRSATLPATTETSLEAMDANTLLTVNGKPVTRAMYSLYFQDRMRGVPDAKNSPEMQMSVLNELANILIVSQDAEKAGLQDREDIAASLELLKAKLLTQAAIQDFASKNKPSDEEVQKAYDAEYAGQSTTEYKARHILLKEEDEAKKLITKLDEGGDFIALAKEHSTGPTGTKGGDLGWFDAAQMVKPFADALSKMEKGKYTSAPVKTQFGWHIILLEDSRQSPPPSLDSVRDKIVASLQQKELANFMQGLRDSSTLVFNEENAKPAPAAKKDGPAELSKETGTKVETTKEVTAEPSSPDAPAEK
jgi:peptidyl-prolyl cis-trans isomerase C